jgi:hypothetical protein
VLEERDERGRDRHHLARRHVHVPGVLRIDLLRVAALDPAEHARAIELAGLLVEDLVRLDDVVQVLTVGGQEVDLVRDLAAHDLAVRGLDEPVLVDAREGRERSDEADVRAFRSLDRAHAAVVGRVHVADLEAGALTGQTAGAEGR